MDEVYKIKAELNNIVYPKGKQSDEMSFKIANFTVSDVISQPNNEFEIGSKYSIKGDMPLLSYKDEYIICVKIVGRHPQYGNQYEKVSLNTSYEIVTNNDASKFLKRILSESQYDSISKTIKDPLKVIKSGDIDSLTSVSGIGLSTAQKILDKYNKSKDYAEIYVELSQYNLTDTTIDKLTQKYKSARSVIDAVKNNIYVLSGIDGFGFVKADNYFIKGGGQPTSPKRINAYISHYLKEQSLNGNSWVNSNVFAKEIYKVFGDDLDRNVFRGVLQELEDHKIIQYDRDKKRVGLMSMYKLEKMITREIRRIQGGENLKYRSDWMQVVKHIEDYQGWTYTDSQKDGIKTILDNQFVLVTGLGGTGKSTLLKAVTSIYDEEYPIIQCALSGCASQRMKQVSDSEANTIHKTLEYNPAQGYIRNQENPLDAKVVILDEASMVSGDLFIRLLVAIRTGTKLIIVGDYGQLESIGVCNVFFDLLKSNIPIVKLTEVHRQAKASAIISKSIDIRHKIQLFESDFMGRSILGELQDLELNIDRKEKLQSYAIRQFLHHTKKVGVSNVLGVTPMRDRGSLSCYEMNTAIQSHLELDRSIGITRKLGSDKQYTFYVGDKVINIKNNYKTLDTLGNKTPIFNGNIGIVKEITGDVMVISFAGIGDIIIEKNNIDQIELAYFITVHKSQGSEAQVVVVAIDYSAYTMLTNELLYTAITRAKQYCVLVGENSAIRKAIKSPSTTTKNTYLKDFLESVA